MILSTRFIRLFGPWASSSPARSPTAGVERFSLAIRALVWPYTSAYNGHPAQAGRRRQMVSIGSGTAIERHLDQLETIFNILLVAIMIVLFGAADASQKLPLFGTAIETASAYGIVLAFFDTLLLAFAHIFWKIGDLLAQCDNEEEEKKTPDSVQDYEPAPAAFAFSFA